MFTIDFNTPIHVHFIGIGGISMSGLAKILLDRHFTVSGSDAHISDLTTELQQDGCIALDCKALDKADRKTLMALGWEVSAAHPRRLAD